MRKQNHLIPPALKHDSRLINAVVRSGKCKRPNAQKHGIYAAAAIIPGEDSREYQELLDELMAEWKPSGPTLREGVVDLADWMWKRRRLRRFIQTQLIGGMFHPSTPAFNEAWGLIAFIHYLRTEPETCFEQSAQKYLRADKIKYLKQKFPRSNYQSTLEWVEAITKEIFSVLIPAIPKESEPGEEQMEPGEEQMMEALRQWKADRQVAGTILQAVELLDYEFKQSQLIEARIEHKTKSLFQFKTMEQMLGQT